MTPTTTDRDPVPPRAAPCRECGTTGGAIPRRGIRPGRSQGLCYRCYGRLNSQGRLDLGQGPCLSCGPRGHAFARGLCSPCYERATGQGIVKRYPQCGAVPVPYLGRTQPAHPAPLPAVVTPAMLGITPGEIGKRYFTAQVQLWADEAACILAGARWRQRHPEQFTAEHIDQMFSRGHGDATHAFWREDAAAAA